MGRLSKKATYRDIGIATILLVVSLAINIVKAIIVHKADNSVELHGKVTGKSKIKNLYTLDCGAYGKFLVSKEQYEQVNVGDDIPSYLKGRGQ